MQLSTEFSMYIYFSVSGVRTNFKLQTLQFTNILFVSRETIVKIYVRFDDIFIIG